METWGSWKWNRSRRSSEYPEEKTENSGKHWGLLPHLALVGAPIFASEPSSHPKLLLLTRMHIFAKLWKIERHRCGNNYGWRQFEGHRCVFDIQDGEPESFKDKSDVPIPFEFPLTCADDGVRDAYTFPEFR